MSVGIKTAGGRSCTTAPAIRFFSGRTRWRKVFFSAVPSGLPKNPSTPEPRCVFFWPPIHEHRPPPTRRVLPENGYIPSYTLVRRRSRTRIPYRTDARLFRPCDTASCIVFAGENKANAPPQDAVASTKTS